VYKLLLSFIQTLNSIELNVLYQTVGLTFTLVILFGSKATAVYMLISVRLTRPYAVFIPLIAPNVPVGHLLLKKLGVLNFLIARESSIDPEL
jgi:hypothetical protein